MPPSSERAIRRDQLAATRQERPIGDGVPSVWGSIPPRNPNFTGREELLEQLAQRLGAGTTAILPAALHGMGGIGKTQMAVEYIYRHLTDYDVVWWIQATEATVIRASLTELGQHLQLTGVGEPTTAVPAVLEALRLGRPFRRWLLIFDSAEEPELVCSFFPIHGPGEILVTSRSPNWAAMARPLEVNVFTRSESKSLLHRATPDLDDSDANQIAEKLGNLPAAIDRAAAWLAGTGLPASDYLQHFDRILEKSTLHRHPSIAASQIIHPRDVVSADRKPPELASKEKFAEYHASVTRSPLNSPDVDSAPDTPLRTAHFTIVGIDVEGFGQTHRNNTNRARIRDGLYQATERAFESSGVTWADCTRADLGDGVLVLAPADIPKPLFTEKLPRALLSELIKHNSTHPRQEKMRLRMAIHAGEVTIDSHGYTGNSIIHMFRILNGATIKEVFSSKRSTPLAVISSDWFFEEVIRHSEKSEAGSYRSYRVKNKETETQIWTRFLRAQKGVQ